MATNAFEKLAADRHEAKEAAVASRFLLIQRLARMQSEIDNGLLTEAMATAREIAKLAKGLPDRVGALLSVEARAKINIPPLP